MKPTRAFLGLGLLLLCLSAVPPSAALQARNSASSLLKYPILLTVELVRTARDFFSFRKNARENRRLKEMLGRVQGERRRLAEAAAENARLQRLLDLSPSPSFKERRPLFARVIGRSPRSWLRVILIDKGSRQGIKAGMTVMDGQALAGIVMEAGPAVSKVLLITDPNSRISVLVQSSRFHGILYGTLSGQCRLKYLPLEAALKPGDLIETAGLGGLFDKGLAVGTIERVWKEPGQPYQVAQVRPLADMNRLEEVMCLE